MLANVEACDVRATRGGYNARRKDACRGCLARAIRSKKTENFASMYLEIQLIDRGHVHARVRLRKIFGADYVVVAHVLDLFAGQLPKPL